MTYADLARHHLGGLATTAATGMVQDHTTSAATLAGKTHAEDSLPGRRGNQENAFLETPSNCRSVEDNNSKAPVKFKSTPELSHQAWCF